MYMEAQLALGRVVTRVVLLPHGWIVDTRRGEDLEGSADIHRHELVLGGEAPAEVLWAEILHSTVFALESLGDLCAELATLKERKREEVFALGQPCEADDPCCVPPETVARLSFVTTA